MKPFKREYEYFLLLCRSLNISVAAEEAGIQQAGLSKSLKALEDEIKKPLFYRTNRGLQLTSYGETFRDLLINTSTMWEMSLEKEMTKYTEMLGTYKLGVHSVIAVNLLPKFLPDLIEDHEGLRLEIELKRSAEVTKDVVNYKLDIGLVANPLRHPDLVINKLYKEYIGFWSSPKKIEKKILYYNPEMIEIFQTIKKYQDYKLVEISDYEVIASMAHRFHGVCLLPSPVAERHNLSQVGRPLLDIDICLIYRHDSLKTRAFKEIVERIKGIS